MTIAALNQNPPGEKLDGWWVNHQLEPEESPDNLGRTSLVRDVPD